MANWIENAKRFVSNFTHVNSITVTASPTDVPQVSVEWSLPKPENEIAQDVISFLEDKRVLYNDYELEVPSHCAESVIHIREYLTQQLQGMPNTLGLPAQLRMMRGACRTFLNKVQTGRHSIIWENGFEGGPESWTFCTALGELRSLIGVYVALLMAEYDLGVEGDLAKILPLHPGEDNTIG